MTNNFFSMTDLNDLKLDLVTLLGNDLPVSEENGVNVVIPAAGEGRRFAEAGWLSPKPLIDVNGFPMISLVVRNLSARHFNFNIAAQRRHKSGFENISFGDIKPPELHYIDGITSGAAETVIRVAQHLPPELPLCIANSDQIVDISMQDFVDDFVERQLDGSIMVFEDPTSNPKWSFAKLDDNGFVTEVAEKKPISNLATVGIYLFRRTDIFIAAVRQMVAANDRTNNEYYNAPAFNYLIQAGGKVGCFEISMTAMKPLGTPEDLERYLKDQPSAALL